MTNETGYNGWKNYETWNIALWLDNDKSTYDLMREFATESINETLLENDDFVFDGSNKEELVKKSSYKLSEKIKEYIEENNPITEQASVYVDLLKSAISQADFIEIAEHYLEEDLVEETLEHWDFVVFYGRDFPDDESNFASSHGIRP
jgi:gas vesicle protein